MFKRIKRSHDGSLIIESAIVAAFFLLMLSAGGCAGRSKALSQDVSRVDQELKSLRTFQAEQTAEISQLRQELRQLVGRVEELEHVQQVANSPGLHSLKEGLSELQRLVPPPAIVPVAALEQDELAVKELPQDIASLFGNALMSIRKGAYRDALPLLQNAADLSYGEEWSANIFFWVGVCYDGIGDNKRALGAYHEGISRFPKHPRTPLALMRQASVFIRLGDTKTAKLTYSKLIADFPKSSEAVAAKARLKDL